MNKLDMKSVNIVDENIEKIGAIFPNVIVESDKGKSIDFDLLKQELSNVAVEGSSEKYELTWPGKKESIVLANTPSTNTLRPIKEKSVDFENTQNIYIEGDNLEVLKILQNSYLNKIKCIYIDPPYNTGNDFIYNDDFRRKTKEELLAEGRIDEEGNVYISKDINNQSNGRFHSDWLSMMYPRLKLAKNLLTDDGIIFISIDDNEQANLKKICDEIFGEPNCIGVICWQKKTQPSFLSKKISTIKEYILIYCKSNSNNVSTMGGLTDSNKLVEMINISNQRSKRVLRKENVLIENGNYSGVLKSGKYGNGDLYIELKNDTEVVSGKINNDIILEGRFKWNQETMNISFDNGDIYHIKNVSSMRPTVEKKNNTQGTKPILDLLSKKINNEIPTNTDATNELKKLFNGFCVLDYPKPSQLVKYLIRSISYDDRDGIMLDFFSGSATTAHAVMQLNAEDGGNRKYIMVQLPEKTDGEFDTICDLGEERIRRAAKKIKEETNADIDYGFRVYKIDSSNMKDEYYMTPDMLVQEQLTMFEDNMKGDRTGEDLLTQVILDLGLPLDYHIEEKNIKGYKVFDVDDGELLACFDNNVKIDIIDDIANLKPRMVVFRDSSFASDQDKVNFEERLKRLSPDTKFNVL